MLMWADWKQATRTKSTAQAIAVEKMEAASVLWSFDASTLIDRGTMVFRDAKGFSTLLEQILSAVFFP